MNAPTQLPPAEPRHATLYAAIGAAALDMAALVAKAGTHEQKNFSYVRHEDVLEHTRNVLLLHGVVVVHGDLRFVERVQSRGDNSMLLWEQTVSAVHAPTGETLERKVQVATLPDDASAAKASTAADRIFRMRLCQLGGGAEQIEEQRGGQRGRGRREEAEERPDPREQEQATAAALKALGNVKLDEASLLHFYRAALGHLDTARATDAQRDRVWDAFAKRCKEARLDAQQLVERAAAPSSNRRNPKE